LGERSIPSDGLSIDVGAGEMVLELPESVGYTLEYDLGVGNITSNEGEIATFVAGDKTYESENYNSAELKIKITANVGVGSLVINRY
jgi:predicted membrane protein